MKIEKNMVVSINYVLLDSTGNAMEKTESPVSYLHGGFDEIFPIVEETLQNKEIGYSCSILMSPEDHFGEYDSNLVRIEPRNTFPDNIKIGMQFEGEEENSRITLIYTITDITEDKVIVDGNHPLAGMTLHFDCTVTGVRPATEEEISHGHVHE
jgi:FKBP-type peptidyl-prolyl cis-trans isomerase SlyD